MSIYFFCFFRVTEYFSHKRSMKSVPALCLVPSYSSPGFPSPAINRGSMLLSNYSAASSSPPAESSEVPSEDPSSPSSPSPSTSETSGSMLRTLASVTETTA